MGMGFGAEKCTMLIMKGEESKGIAVQNQKIVKTLGEKENGK